MRVCGVKHGETRLGNVLYIGTGVTTYVVVAGPMDSKLSIRISWLAPARSVITTFPDSTSIGRVSYCNPGTGEKRITLLRYLEETTRWHVCLPVNNMGIFRRIISNPRVEIEQRRNDPGLVQDTKHDRECEVEYDPHNLQQTEIHNYRIMYVRHAELTQNVFFGHCVVEVATSTSTGRIIGHKNLGS